MSRPANAILKYKYEDIVKILIDMEKTLMSLHYISSCYYKDGEEKVTADLRMAYERETTRYIDECHVTQRLAQARAVLTSAFDLTLGDDELDDIEREMQHKNLE